MHSVYNFIRDLCLQLLDGSFAKQVTHEIDGLIFQPVAEVMQLQVKYCTYQLQIFNKIEYSLQILILCLPALLIWNMENTSKVETSQAQFRGFSVANLY